MALERQDHHYGCAVMKSAELAVGTSNLPVGVAADELCTTEHASDGLELETKYVANAQASGHAIEKQRCAGLLSPQRLNGG